MWKRDKGRGKLSDRHRESVWERDYERERKGDVEKNKDRDKDRDKERERMRERKRKLAKWEMVDNLSEAHREKIDETDVELLRFHTF